MRSSTFRGAGLALGAAALFGASVPLSKLLLLHVHVVMLSSLLYLGAGLGVSLFRVALGHRWLIWREAPLVSADVPFLAGMVASGGIAGPILMLAGLRQVSGVSGALLLNLEVPFTILLAMLFFSEHVGVRAALATLAIAFGAGVLVYEPIQGNTTLLGAVTIAGACAAWALDNNLSRCVSLRDPLAVVQVKALGAGSCTLIIALLIGAATTSPLYVAGALLLGGASYGASLVLTIRAMRELGAVRQAAYFATAPFFGALLSLPLLSERPRMLDGVVTLLMVGGVTALMRERHWHMHTHEAMEHEHLHVHDEHHQHEHRDTAREPHSHSHRHAPMTHEHAHVPDFHHRHLHR